MSRSRWAESVAGRVAAVITGLVLVAALRPAQMGGYGTTTWPGPSHPGPLYVAFICVYGQFCQWAYFNEDGQANFSDTVPQPPYNP